ncbi:hypothetical protein RQP46_006042 [Phenoliferia psychrophenolica]
MLTWKLALGAALLSGVTAQGRAVQNRGRHGWWGAEDKDAIMLEIRTDGPLVECASVMLDWSSDEIPKDRAISFHVVAEPTWPEEEGRQAVVPQQDFVTPATAHSWIVDYPAGTVIEFTLSPWNSWRYSGGKVFGESQNFTVQPGTTDCLPKDHFPIITVPPTKLIECEPAVFRYSGGEGPFEAYALGKLTSGDWQFETIRNVGNDSFAWVADYPVGTEVDINIYQSGGMVQTRLEMTVTEKGHSTACIPTNHYPAARRWYRHPAMIVAYVFTGIIFAAGAGYMGYRGWLTYQARRSGEIRLNDD